jgi:hypothetical protein
LAVNGGAGVIVQPNDATAMAARASQRTLRSAESLLENPGMLKRALTSKKHLGLALVRREESSFVVD